MRRSAILIHLTKVACKPLRNLERGEVPSYIVLGFKHELAERVGPSSRRTVNVRPSTVKMFKNTHNLGRRQVSAGKYDTPSGTDVHPGGAGIECLKPSVIS